MKNTAHPLRRALVAASLLAGLVPWAGAQAQGAAAYPSKPVRIIVGFPAGTGPDIVARLLAQKLSEGWGNAGVIVDNKPGAGGLIAASEAARAAPDGYTLMLGETGQLSIAPSSYNKLPYDPAKDFRPVSLLAKVPSLYLVHPDLPVRNMAEFVAHAKKNPGRLNYGSAGNGSAGHLAMEYLKIASGTFITHVPYRGTGPMLTDLIAGRLEAASIGAAAVLQFIRAGKLRCIATGTTKRIAQLPDVPTVAEQGFPGFEMTQWYGLNVPASLPQAAIDKLAAAAAKAVNEPATLERLANDAALPVGSTPADYAKFIDAEQKRWKPVIARAKIKPD